MSSSLFRQEFTARYARDRRARRGKIPKGTRFEDLPEDWKCPVCGAGKKMFRPLRGPGSAKDE